MKCNKFLTKGLPKNLKEYANTRQVKHTSTVLEPSISFHTLVKLVDAEDIANDKIHTHDLTLEVNSITNQLQSQNLETQQSEHVMFTQPRDPNNKHKPAYRNIVQIVKELSFPSLLVSTNNDMMKIKEMHYNTTVLLLVKILEQITNVQSPMIDTAVEVHHVIVIQIAILHHKIDITLTLETDTDMTELLLLHNLTD